MIIIAISLFMICPILLTGCGSSRKPPETAAPLPAPIVLLSPGDTIEIKFPYAEQFNETQTIRPDGKISLPLVGELQAAGKTPSDLQEQLIQVHSAHLQHPELAVIVRTQYERKVYVGGAVNQPGLIDMPGKLTALEAIMEAGGFDLTTAAVDSVILIRYNNGNTQSHQLKLEPAIEGIEHAPVYLEPRDVVFVPRTTIVEVGQWVQQHIYDLLPIGRLGFGYTLN